MTNAANGPPKPTSWPLRFYGAATHMATPLVQHILRSRLKAGKEDEARLPERMGYAGKPRPDGPLVWIHGVSVGESTSALPIIERILSNHPGTNILITTGTITSAQLLEKILPPGVIHQFIPVDLPQAVERFLDHWQPQAALFMESELWPNLIMQTAGRNIPMAQLNARISEKTFNRWLRARTTINALLSSFDICLAQDTDIAGRLQSLGAHNVKIVGNLKFAASPLGADEQALETLQAQIGDRPVWLASQTHEGEERAAGHVHAFLKETIPQILTLVVPRHPNRLPDIIKTFEDIGHKVAVRSRNDPITPTTDIYIADTFGELGLFFRLADIVFVGGSLVPVGGHNPLEPARLNCAILYGPYTENNFSMFRELAAAGAAISVVGREQLAKEVATLLSDRPKIDEMSESAFRICARADGVISRAMAELAPILRSALASSPPTHSPS